MLHCFLLLSSNFITQQPVLGNKNRIRFSEDERENKDVLSQVIKLDHNYNRLVLPVATSSNSTSSPCLVSFQINLRNILEVNEVSQTCSLETTIRMFWKDPRVKLHQIHDNGYFTLNPDVASFLWIPDVFIDQAKSLRSPTIFVRPASLRIYNDSTIRFAARVNFDVACKMQFHYYPKDQQVCEVKLESFGYTTSQLRYRWIEGNNINSNISLAQFDFKVDFRDNYATDYYTLSYPGIIMRITFQRKISFHVVQTYIPSAMFVVLAWLTIFIPPDQIPGRVTVTMTTLLTLTAMFGAVRTNVPKVSYVSLLDIWMFACIMFVFGVIVHFVLVIALLRNGYGETSQLVEYAGVVLVPILFAAFNVAYWTMLSHI